MSRVPTRNVCGREKTFLIKSELASEIRARQSELQPVIPNSRRKKSDVHSLCFRCGEKSRTNEFARNPQRKSKHGVSVTQRQSHIGGLVRSRVISQFIRLRNAADGKKLSRNSQSSPRMKVLRNGGIVIITRIDVRRMLDGKRSARNLSERSWIPVKRGSFIRHRAVGLAHSYGPGADADS